MATENTYGTYDSYDSYDTYDTYGTYGTFVFILQRYGCSTISVACHLTHAGATSASCTDCAFIGSAADAAAVGKCG